VSFSHSLVVGFFKGLTSLMCRIDDGELVKVPRQGPLIIYTNHVNLLEIPIIYTHLQPRRVHGMAYAQRWENSLFGWILDVSESIPLHRDEADITAIKKGLDVLEKGEILMIAPEGTRSHDGRLGAAHSGVVVLALHSHARLIPMAYFGAERYAEELRRLKRSDFHLRVGKPFHLEAGAEKVTRQVREQMLEEMMYQLAAVLPLQYRGLYAERSPTNLKYIIFDK